MESVNFSSIVKSLLKVGVEPGQILYVYSDLIAPGMIKGAKDRDEFCKTYLDAIMSILGNEGTIVMPAYTPQVGRFGVEFDTEVTPSLAGLFSEYLRLHKNSIRSNHPLHSVSAIGAKKEFFCRDLGTSDYSWNSPFQRLHQVKAKVLSIGLCPGYSLGLSHYVESMCGVPYIYNKLLVWPSKTAGNPDPRKFFASARHLKLNYKQDFTHWAKLMHKASQIKGARLGGSHVVLADFSRAFEIAAEEIKSNPYFLLDREPNFVYGEVPFDGPTFGHDGVKVEGSVNKVERKVNTSQVQKQIYLKKEISQKIICV